MMNWRGGKALVSLLFVLFGVSGTAAGENTWREWSESPQALFMTAEEKLEWKKVEDERAAEQFVAQYMARRGKGFRRELERRIEMADRYLGSEKTRGSESLGGKVVILLGAPTRIERDGGVTTDLPENSAINDVYTNVGPMGMGSTRLGVTPVVYTFRYSGDQVRERLARKALILRIELDPETGEEALIEQPGAPSFETISRQVAESSVVTNSDDRVQMADLH